MRSLHHAEVEVYEGKDEIVDVKDAKGKETTPTVRVKKDPNALPLIRLKLYDKKN